MWMQHRLDAGYPLCLLRRIAAGVCVVLNWGHIGHVRVMMILWFFLEVRNANSTVIVVMVGTVVLLLLRRPISLCEIL